MYSLTDKYMYTKLLTLLFLFSKTEIQRTTSEDASVFTDKFSKLIFMIYRSVKICS